MSSATVFGSSAIGTVLSEFRLMPSSKAEVGKDFRR
jgi:hypothetical protein